MDENIIEFSKLKNGTFIFNELMITFMFFMYKLQK